VLAAWKKWGAIALVGAALSACGYNTLPIAPYTDPLAGDYGPGLGYGGGGFFNSPTGAVGGYMPSTPANAPAMVNPTPPELTLRQVRKQVTGALLWKRLKVSGQVINNQNVALKGELRVSFTRRGKVVETQTVLIPDLVDGQAKSFSLTSKRACDDVELNLLSEVTMTPVQSGVPNVSFGQSGGMGGFYE